MVPYIQGISEKFKKLCKSKGIQVYFKGTNTLKMQLVTHKDKEPKLQKGGIIYHYKCPHINCTEAYIGETGRGLGDRINEHLKAPSPPTRTPHLPVPIHPNHPPTTNPRWGAYVHLLVSITWGYKHP